jgi:hypothetical protein
MDITITQENITAGIILLLLILQGYNRYQIEKLKEDNKKLWDQISLWNTMVAIKLLDTQKEINKLSNKENNDGEQTKESN